MDDPSLGSLFILLKLAWDERMDAFFSLRGQAEKRADGLVDQTKSLSSLSLSHSERSPFQKKETEKAYIRKRGGRRKSW